MDNKCEFNIQEYISIRDEMIQRLAIINSQSHTAIITIITSFGAGISLKYEAQAEDIVNIISFNIMRSLIFLIPIVYLLPLAVKSGENLIQIASLSAYIRIFYDYLSKDKIRMNWETSNNMLSNANVNRGRRSFYMRLYNEEYTVLACVSFILYMFFSILSIKIIMPIVDVDYVIALIILYIILSIFSLYAICFIHKASGMKNTLMKYTPIYIEGYVKRAVQLKIITEAEAKKVWEETNPNNAIHLGFWGENNENDIYI